MPNQHLDPKSKIVLFSIIIVVVVVVILAILVFFLAIFTF